jgi:hypothetical protein
MASKLYLPQAHTTASLSLLSSPSLFESPLKPGICEDYSLDSLHESGWFNFIERLPQTIWNRCWKDQRRERILFLPVEPPSQADMMNTELCILALLLCVCHNCIFTATLRSPLAVAFVLSVHALRPITKLHVTVKRLPNSICPGSTQRQAYHFYYLHLHLGAHSLLACGKVTIHTFYMNLIWFNFTERLLRWIGNQCWKKKYLRKCFTLICRASLEV